MGEWHVHRRCPENFSAVTGQALDQPDTDSFYGWGALMPAIAVAETTDITPWDGFEVTHGESICLGPLLTPLGMTTIDSGSGVLTVTTSGERRLATSLKGRIARIELRRNSVSLQLPAGAAGWIELPGAPIAFAALDGRPIAAKGERFEIPARDKPQRLELMRGQK